ncbi:MAG: SDR family oxidoreductase [Chitinophagaceae bacterium]
MTRILVTGGTGTLGRQVVQQLLDEGFQVRVLCSVQKPSLPTGATAYQGDIRDAGSLEGATAQMDQVIHCASNPLNPWETDVEGTRNLLAAAEKSLIRHLIYISIVGVDQSTYPYYQAKFEVEKEVIQSAVPWSILRTTQFHELILQWIRSWEKEEKEVFSIPDGWQFQPIAAGEVAQVLVGLAKMLPAGRVPDWGGPQILPLEDLVATYEQLKGRKNTFQKIGMEGPRNDLFRSKIHLSPQQQLGRVTWKEFLGQPGILTTQGKGTG